MERRAEGQIWWKMPKKTLNVMKPRDTVWMGKDRDLAMDFAQKTADKNGCPVWIEHHKFEGTYYIHETPEDMPDTAWIIEPTEEVT